MCARVKKKKEERKRETFERCAVGRRRTVGRRITVVQIKVVGRRRRDEVVASKQKNRSKRIATRPLRGGSPRFEGRRQSAGAGGPRASSSRTRKKRRPKDQKRRSMRVAVGCRLRTFRWGGGHAIRPRHQRCHPRPWNRLYMRTHSEMFEMFDRMISRLL